MRSPETIAKELASAQTVYCHAARPHPATGKPDVSPESLASFAQRIRDLEAELAAAARTVPGVY